MCKPCEAGACVDVLWSAVADRYCAGEGRRIAGAFVRGIGSRARASAHQGASKMGSHEKQSSSRNGSQAPRERRVQTLT